jgi:hypothetical protein
LGEAADNPYRVTDGFWSCGDIENSIGKSENAFSEMRNDIDAAHRHQSYQPTDEHYSRCQMIIREWRGRAALTDVEAYPSYFRNNVVPELKHVPGFFLVPI